MKIEVATQAEFLSPVQEMYFSNFENLTKKYILIYVYTIQSKCLIREN